MQQCVELQRAGVQPTMPLLGSFCIEKLKLQMKVMLFCVLCLLSMMCCTAKYPVVGTGFLLLVADALFADTDASSVPLSGLPASLQGRLKPFLERRKQLCSLSDDGRQHVNLTPAGAMLGGGSISSGVGGVVGGGSASAPSAPLLGLAAGGLPGGSGGGASLPAQARQAEQLWQQPADLL